MEPQAFQIINNKILIHIHDTVCENAHELLNSRLFKEILELAAEDLMKRKSHLLQVFAGRDIHEQTLRRMTKCLMALTSANESDQPSKELALYADFLNNRELLNDFVEYVYNFWRMYDRFIICDSMGRDLDKRPYRTFNATIGQLTHLIRGMYRDIQEAITGYHPRIYRQVAAGAEMATISVTQALSIFDKRYEVLSSISMVRQVLLNPPLILNPPANIRKGQFVRVDQNPVDLITIHPSDWLCYPAKVGPLTMLVYFHKHFIELGLSLCNLFQLAEDDDLMKKPDALYFFGVPGNSLDSLASFPTVFYEDEKNDLWVAAVPNREEFGYFGYLKKMMLTLHNVIMMKRGRWPYHGALVKLILKGPTEHTLLMVGDTGAGKSETLEAFRALGESDIQDFFVIADDMGSLEMNAAGDFIGYGTEIGAFLRLDDLTPGYALGQIDRAIIMSPNQINARIILPVTTYQKLSMGCRVDYILYTNNYEDVDEDHPVVERFDNLEAAYHVFREGTVMSKGTTASTGIVHTYFANIFGPIQYRELHERLAKQYFQAFFEKGIFVGQIRTRLGLKGFEQKGPQEAARQLLNILQKNPSR